MELTDDVTALTCLAGGSEVTFTVLFERRSRAVFAQAFEVVLRRR